MATSDTASSGRPLGDIFAASVDLRNLVGQFVDDQENDAPTQTLASQAYQIRLLAHRLETTFDQIVPALEALSE